MSARIHDLAVARNRLRLGRIVSAISSDSDEAEIIHAHRDLQAAMLAVTAPTAAFVNTLDDGNGWCNSTAEAGAALVSQLDASRLSFILGCIHACSPAEVQLVYRMAECLASESGERA